METEIHRFATDRDFPERGASTEHHGGNLTIAPDGLHLSGHRRLRRSASSLRSSTGMAARLWRIDPDGTAVQFAHGFRNPFDLAWDAAAQRIILTDNGDVVDDEIDIVTLATMRLADDRRARAGGALVPAPRRMSSRPSLRRRDSRR